MDKIVVNLDTDQRECVACGFSEARPADKAPPQGSPPVAPGIVPGTTPSRELPTRVSRPAARRVETPAEPVRLVDPGKKQG
jgi:hypothetical protein